MSLSLLDVLHVLHCTEASSKHVGGCVHLLVCVAFAQWTTERENDWCRERSRKSWTIWKCSKQMLAYTLYILYIYMDVDFICDQCADDFNESP